MNIIIMYKIAQALTTPTADDSIPGDLPDAPSGESYTGATKRLTPEQIIRNMLSFSKNVPVIERHETGEGLYG